MIDDLSREEKEEYLNLLELKAWKNDPWQFIHDACLTIDEADEGKVKYFPDKAYLKRICELAEREKILCIPKSRRMMMTWCCLAICLWEAMYRENQTIFIQSKKFDDSAYLMGESRFMFMYNNLPHDRHDFPKISKKISSDKGYSLIRFTNGTTVIAVAAGADQLRQYTASRVYCTEMAFWENAEETWTALRPVIQGGGRIMIDSSANPGFFCRVCTGALNKEEENKPVEKHEEIQGVTEYIKNGAYIARVHYTADPDKRSKEWLKEQKQGTETKAWEREYEINWEVSLEEPYYPEFHYETHVASSPLIADKRRPLELGFDYGLTPATIICQTTAKGQLLILKECQSWDVGMRNHAKALKADLAAYFYGFSLNCVGDPAGNQRSQADEKTANQILRDDFGWYIQPGAISQTERAEAVRWFLTSLTSDGKPMLLVDPSCTWIISALSGGYHRKKVGERLLDEPDKNEYSHIIDCLAYVCAKIYSQSKNPWQKKFQEERKKGRIRKWGTM